MGKKQILKLQKESEKEDEELSDLEIAHEVNDDSNPPASDPHCFINEEKEMEKLTKNMKEEFSKMTQIKNTWIETLTLVADTQIDTNLNTDDDIKRELIFYNITHQNSIKGINKLKELKEKINRPDDFFAEMLKSDMQMGKVKRKIIEEQQSIKKFEERKQKLHNIKFSKTFKDFQNKEKASFKKKTLEGVKNWKKNLQNNPSDYYKLDQFFDNEKTSNKYGKKKEKDLKGFSVRHKTQMKRASDFKHYQKKNRQNRRPGKVKRMINRNKKNSKKGK